MPEESGDLLLPPTAGDTERDLPGEITTGGFLEAWGARLGSGTTKPSSSTEWTESREDPSTSKEAMDASLRISGSSESSEPLSLEQSSISESLLLGRVSLILFPLFPLLSLLCMSLSLLILPFAVLVSLLFKVNIRLLNKSILLLKSTHH